MTNFGESMDPGASKIRSILFIKKSFLFISLSIKAFPRTSNGVCAFNLQYDSLRSENLALKNTSINSILMI